MKPPIRRLALLLTLFVTATAAPADAPDEARALLQMSEDRMRSDSSTALYRIEIVRPDWRRSLRFRSHDDRTNDRFRMEILEPRKTRGTVFLKQGGRLSMYLPKLRRKIAISPAMMHDPWMGSDFNNQDLIESASLVRDYTHRIVAREGEGPQQIVTIESIPSAQATVVWGKLLHRITAQGLPVQIDYYDAKDKVLRRMRFEDVKTLGGRELPTRWVMTPAGKAGQYTEIILEDVEFDVPVPDELFDVPAKGGH